MKYITFFITCFTFIYTQSKPQIDWGLSIRNRSNLQIFNDMDNTFNELRSRLAISVIADDGIGAFAQIQDSRVFGQEAPVVSSAISSTLRNTANIDLHQAYLKIEKLFDSDFNFKIGRMEINHANQRIVGSVGWHNVGRSLDGAVLTYKTESALIDLFSHKLFETGFNSDSLDVVFSGLRSKFSPFQEMNAEVYYYSLATRKAESNLQTVGFYISGKSEEFTYETQFAFQFGSASPVVDFAAHYLFGMMGYQLNEDSKFAVSFELLSGDNGSDLTKIKSFSPFFGTNHKFNGYMDKFFVGATKIANTNGLNDLTISYTTLKSLKFDFHFFSNNKDAFLGTQKLSGSIGNELDITYKYKYSNNLTIFPGFSYFLFSDDYKNSSDTSDMYGYLILAFTL